MSSFLPSRRCLFWSLLAGLLCCAALLPRRAAAQDAAAEAAVAPRKLAPGILTIKRPEVLDEELFSEPGPLVEIVNGIPGLDAATNYTPKSRTLKEMARKVTLRRAIWNLEFAFKPLRMIYVDVPQPNGKMRRKLVWYMVYSVKNNGRHLAPVAQADRFGDKTYTAQQVDHAIRFFPHFVLESKEVGKSYLNRFIPSATEVIRRRELPRGRLYNAIEIADVPIEVSDERVDRSVWSVVTWEDVDPRIDFFSIYIQGLTNAYKFEDQAGAFKPGDPFGTGRKLTYKTLQLNFWRPGDIEAEHEGEIRFGAPYDSNPAVQRSILDNYGITKRLDHLWVYR